MAAIAWFPRANADEVSVGGGKPVISKQDCMALARYHEAPGVEYQPGVDVHGKPVAPADLQGGASYDPPTKIEFNVTINPIQYGQRNALQSQISQTQATLAANPGNVAAQEQLSSLQRQLSAISGKFDNTAAPVGHVVVDLKSGQVTLNGKPVEGPQQRYLDDVCRQAGY
jgi:hypothetical protein